MNIDASAFPMVWMHTGEDKAVPVEEVLTSISALLARDEPFAFLAEGAPDDADDNVEERRKVAQWMKANSAALRRLVKGHVQIVPDVAQQVAMAAFATGFARFWGYPMFVVASLDEGHAKARSLLADS